MKKLPPWFPGASFVRGAILQRSLIPQIMDVPFEYVKKNMASVFCWCFSDDILNYSQATSTAAPSMMSDALLRIWEKAKDEREVTILEKAVKEASFSGYSGS